MIKLSPWRVCVRSAFDPDSLLLLAVLSFLGIATVLVAYPGLVAYDATMQLREALTGEYVGFSPPFMGWVMARLYQLRHGTGLFLLLNVGLLYFSLYCLLQGRPERSLVLPVWVLACMAPVLLIYNGTIVKDVFAANLAIAGFALLAHRDSVTWLRACVVVFFLVACMQTRQQGIFIALAGAAALAYLRTPGGGFVRLGAHALGWFALMLLVSKIFQYVHQAGVVASAGDQTEIGFLVVFMYDICGIASLLGAEKLRAFAAHGIDLGTFAAELSRHYTPERQDFLNLNGIVYGIVPPDVLRPLIFEQWQQLVLEYPAAYLKVKLGVFSWLAGFHDQLRCAPIASLGVSGPPDMVRELGLAGRFPYKAFLWDYAKPYFEGWMFRPWVYWIATGLAAIKFCFHPVQARDRTLGFLCLAALVYVASFFFFGMACDFRYSFIAILLGTLLFPLAIADEVVFRRRRISAWIIRRGEGVK